MKDYIGIVLMFLACLGIWKSLSSTNMNVWLFFLSLIVFVVGIVLTPKDKDILK